MIIKAKNLESDIIAGSFLSFSLMFNQKDYDLHIIASFICKQINVQTFR